MAAGRAEIEEALDEMDRLRAQVASLEATVSVAEDVASLRQQVSGLQELLERMHVKMAYASKKRA